jgi:CRISPR system Cascade subunit CasA
MSTFVWPAGDPPSLWRAVLANLPRDEKFAYDDGDLPKVLPWLAPTLVSDKGRVVSEGDTIVHPLQAYFGMPRRIALQFAGLGDCAMTRVSGPLVDGFIQKPGGINYGVSDHPLTPYRRQKEDAEPYSVKPKSSRFGYPNWTPVVVGAKEGVLAYPSQNVALARDERREVLQGAALRAAGWAMNNMEAVAYLNAEQPLHLAESQETQNALDIDAWRFTKAAEAAAGLLGQAVKAALFSEGAKAATDATLFEDARTAFYEATENAFHDLLDRRLSAPLADDENLARAWLGELRRAALASFQSAAPLPLGEPERARRIAAAAKTLGFALAGYGKNGRELFETLDLALPETGAAKKSKRDGD